jgi:hypothetical protein
MNKDQRDVSHIDEGEINEPVAVRYDFDGNGYLYMDAGSGSDWASRVKDCEFLYTHPMRDDKDDDIFRKEQVEKFYAEAKPWREKYKPSELTDDEIHELWANFKWSDDLRKNVIEHGRALLKKASEK